MKIRRIAAYRVKLPLHEGSYKWSGGKSVESSTARSSRSRPTRDGRHRRGLPARSGLSAGVRRRGPGGDRGTGAAPDRRGSHAARPAQPPDGRGDEGASLRQVGDRRRLLGHPGEGRRACPSARSWAGDMATTSSSTGRSPSSRPRRWPPRSRAIAPRAIGGSSSRSAATRTPTSPGSRPWPPSSSRATGWSPTPTPAG